MHVLTPSIRLASSSRRQRLSNFEQLLIASRNQSFSRGHPVPPPSPRIPIHPSGPGKKTTKESCVSGKPASSSAR